MASIGIGRFWDSLIHCWRIGNVRCDDMMGVMTLFDYDHSGNNPPWWPGLLSCLCNVLIKDYSVDVVVSYLFRNVHLARLYMMGVTAVAGVMISVAMLTHLGGDRLERYWWLLIVVQWAGLLAPPMSMRLLSVVFFWSGEKLYICPLYTWWISFETTPVTGSLVSVAANLYVAEVGTLFLDIVDSFALAICGTLCSVEMATGSGRLPVGRSGVDFTVQLDVPWNAPEVFVNMEYAGFYELDTESMPDVLGLRAWQPGAAVIRVMTGRDSQSVWALCPDGKVLGKGFHDVTLVDMDHIDGPDEGPVDTLRLMWPVPVVSGMSDLQFELERQLCTCKQWFRGTQSHSCTFCRKLIKLDMGRHIANYHLDITQLWCCLVSWCPQWNGMPQDCVAHLRQAHAVPHLVRAANLGKWFPPWKFPGRCGHEALLPHVCLEYRRIFCCSARGVHH